MSLKQNGEWITRCSDAMSFLFRFLQGFWSMFVLFIEMNDVRIPPSMMPPILN